MLPTVLTGQHGRQLGRLVMPAGGTVGTTEGQQRRVSLLAGGGQVVGELAPLVARQLGMDQVVPLEHDLDMVLIQPRVGQLH